MRTVTLYTKQGCHLCEQALAAVERVRGDVEFELRMRDIDDDEEALRAYFERIPVLLVDGEELCEYHVDEEALRRALALRRSDLTA